MNERLFETALPAVSGPGSIQIFDRRERHDIPEPHGDTRVFVSIGAGETHVTILSAEGDCEDRWTAVFGWSFLCRLPFESADCTRVLESEALVSRAMRGSVKVYGRLVDTTDLIDKASVILKDALEDILSRTVGSGEIHDDIVLAAPPWMHGLLSSAVDIRPHILRDIREL